MKIHCMNNIKLVGVFINMDKLYENKMTLDDNAYVVIS